MDLMYVVTSSQSASILLPMLQASQRRGVNWGCFFTDDGVEVLRDTDICALMSDAQSAFACELSWDRFESGKRCPISLGSQTNNSAMLGKAKHVISL